MPDRTLCVHCRQRLADDRFQPFCSERCKMADLGRWLLGDYRVPVRPDTDPDDPDDTGAPVEAPDEPDRS